MIRTKRRIGLIKWYFSQVTDKGRDVRVCNAAQPADLFMSSVLRVSDQESLSVNSLTKREDLLLA